MTTSGTELPPPPSTTIRWTRLMVGFGVSVAVGLAPLLGSVEVPGFSALLQLFPTLPWDTRKTIIPLAAFAMGVTAAVVQFRASDRLSDKRLRTLFNRTVAAIVVAFLVLVISHTLLVRQIRVPAVESEVPVLIGFYRPQSCSACPASMSDSACIVDRVSLNPTAIESCWGDLNIRSGFLLLALSYLGLMVSFGSLMGYLMRRRPR